MSKPSATKLPSSKLEPIADYACETGENPLWHSTEKQLYWTDIPAGRMFRYDPATGHHEQIYQGRVVGGFTIQADGALLLFMDRGTVAIFQNGDIKELVPELKGEQDSRFNDVIADPRGRVFCGTMSTSDRKGKLYRLDPDGSIRSVIENVGCSNGMAFTRDQRHFFYTDSHAYEIYLFDYDVEDGSLSNRRVFAKFDESGGMPDGATLDSEGHLWSAIWDGARVVRLRPDGSVDMEIPVPTPKASSVTFGGSDYSELYITTAGGNDRKGNGASAGALFRIKPDATGLPEFRSRIGL